MTKTLATNLGLALIISRRIYFDDRPQTEEEISYEQQACRLLELSASETEQIVVTVIENSQCYWPV